MDEILCWLFCVAIANGLWIVVFKSPLVKHLTAHFTGEEFFTSADLENYFLARKMWFVHNLWTCATCQAVWTSGAATILLCIFTPTCILISPLIFLATLPVIKWTQKHL